MYRPRGFSRAELGDIEVVADGDTLHLFHLTLPNHDVVAHAVSTDGLTWRPVAPALRTGAPGALDDDMLWTMSVARADEGTWHMLYTALSTVEGGRVQRVARATSPDLFAWTPRGLAAEAAAPHYAAAVGDAPWVAWRDPKATRVGDTWWATVCARDAAGRGVVGRMTSPDLEAWTLAPPLLGRTRWFELECPQLFELGGRWYLTACVMEDRSQRYWMADAPEGPFRAPPDDRLAPPGHYACRVLRWGDAALLFAMHRLPAGNRVLAPLALEADARGHLRCVPFAGWAARRGDGLDGPTGTLRALDADLAFEDDAPPHAHFHCAVDWVLDARAGGLAFARAGDSMLRVEWQPAEHRVRLLRAGPGRDPDGRAWFTHDVLSEAACPTPRRWAVHVVDGEVQVEAEGQVVLHTWTDAPAGEVALWVEQGAAQVRGRRLAPMNPAG